MTGIRPAQVLLKMCDLVASEMAAGAVSLPGQSFLAAELRAVQQTDRRDFLEKYVCQSMIALLCGVLDQARCLARTLDTPGVAVGPYMLIRGLLEYSYKITYIADPQVDSKERILRTLMLYGNDIRAYQKMPKELRSATSDQLALSRKEMADCWYRELTGKKLKPLTTKTIMDSVWNTGLEIPQQQGPGQSVIYERGYRTASVVTHGNIWAIRHFCLETRYDAEGVVFTPRLQELVLYDLLLIAACDLQVSFGFVAQLGSTLPSGVMNRLEENIYDLETRRAMTQPS